MRRRLNRSLAFATILLTIAVLAGCASRPERQARKMDEMLAARRASDLLRADQGRELIQALMARAESKAAAAKATPTGLPPTIDILVISGGGDWGAFGAGVLKGWGRVNGEMTSGYRPVRATFRRTS